MQPTYRGDGAPERTGSLFLPPATQSDTPASPHLRQNLH